jgi:hypothetical protein
MAGDDVLAEVDEVVVEPVPQDLGVEDVDAHGRQALGRPGDALGRLRLLLEPDDAPGLVHLQHPVLPRGHGGRNADDGHREPGAALLVKLMEPAVVHLVDVVARQDQHVLGGDVVDERQVLADGVGGALVPLVPELHLRRDLLDELVEALREEAEAGGQVPAEGVRLVLREDEDLADVRVDAVREREVDDPEDRTEGHRGLGPDVREGPQPLTHAPCHDDRQDTLCHVLLLRANPGHGGRPPVGEYPVYSLERSFCLPRMPRTRNQLPVLGIRKILGSWFLPPPPSHPSRDPL